MSDYWSMCEVCNVTPAQIDIRGKKYCKMCAYEFLSPSKKKKEEVKK